MDRKRASIAIRTAVVATLTMPAFGVMVDSAAAEPPRPNPIFAHQHYLVVPGAVGEVTVGPDACEGGESRQFDEFHFNVHVGPAPISGRACP
jgi:hypothetical protein